MASYGLLRLKAILNKEFIQIKRDYITFSFVILIPFLQAMFFGYVINTDPKHLPTAILDNDHSSYAQNFIKGLENTAYFTIEQTVTSEAEADDLLKRNKVQFVLNIPGKFAHDLIRGLHPHILLEADGTDPISVIGAYNAANKIAASIYERDFKGPLHYLQPEPNSFVLDLQGKYNPDLAAQYHSLPGLIGIILTSVLVMLTSLSMASEYEQGTFESLLVTPLKPLDLILGKLIPHFIVGYVTFFLLIMMSCWLFAIPFYGSLVMFTLCAAPFMLATLGVGLLCSVVARTQFEAASYGNLFILPSLLLTGFTFPFKGMSPIAQNIGQILPATHFIRISYGIMLKGSNFFEIWPDIWPILLFLVFIISCCWYFYRNTLD